MRELFYVHNCYSALSVVSIEDRHGIVAIARNLVGVGFNYVESVSLLCFNPVDNIAHATSLILPGEFLSIGLERCQCRWGGCSLASKEWNHRWFWEHLSDFS